MNVAGSLGRFGTVLDSEPSPEFAAHIAEECEALPGPIHENRLRRTSLLKLEGYTIAEIARALDCVESTEYRRPARWGTNEMRGRRLNYGPLRFVRPRSLTVDCNI